MDFWVVAAVRMDTLLYNHQTKPYSLVYSWRIRKDGLKNITGYNLTSPILCFAYSILMPELRFEDINTYLYGEEAQPDQNNHTNTTEKKVLEFYTQPWRSNVLSFSSKW